MKSKIYLLFILVLFLNCKANSLDSKQGPGISGEVIKGLRILKIDSNKKDYSFTVYRGDYIKPEIKSVKAFEVIFPELDVKKSYPVKEGDKVYIKMKKKGVFKFAIGDIKGVIKVIEYTQARYKAVNAKEAKDIIKNIAPVILDVRTEREYKMGHINDSVLFPVQILQEQIKKLKKYKDQDILIYCASGNRSTVAGKILIDKGFKKIYNMRYGIKEWIVEGYPVIK